MRAILFIAICLTLFSWHYLPNSIAQDSPLQSISVTGKKTKKLANQKDPGDNEVYISVGGEYSPGAGIVVSKIVVKIFKEDSQTGNLIFLKAIEDTSPKDGKYQTSPHLLELKDQKGNAYKYTLMATMYDNKKPVKVIVDSNGSTVIGTQANFSP